jgi:hypothetical protein
MFGLLLIVTGCFAALGDYVESHSSLSCSHMTGVAGSAWFACNVDGHTLVPPVVTTLANGSTVQGCGVLTCEKNATDAYATVMKNLGRCDPNVVCTNEGDNKLMVAFGPWNTCVQGDGPPDAGVNCLPHGELCDLSVPSTETKPCCKPDFCGHIDETGDNGVCCLSEGYQCTADTDCCPFGTTGCINGRCGCTALFGECGGRGVDSTCCDGISSALECIDGRCCVGVDDVCNNDGECCAGYHCSLNTCSPN